MVDGESVWWVHLCKTTRVHIRGDVVVDGESVWWVHLCKTTRVHIRGDVVLMVSPRGGYTSVRQHVYTLEGMLC